MRWSVVALVVLVVGCSSSKPVDVGPSPLEQTSDASGEGARVRAAQKTVSTAASADSWTSLGIAWMQLGRLRHDAGAIGHAGEAITKALALDPKNPRALLVQGTLAQAERQFDKARVIAEGLTARDAKNAEAWGLLGDARLALGQSAEAFAAYDAMLALAPGVPAYSRAAYARWLTGDVDGSLAMWAEAAKAGHLAEPEPLAYAACGAGDVLWSVGRLDEAERTYAAALKIVPDAPDALLGHGRVMLARGDAAAAIVDLEKAAMTDRREDALHWLAAARVKAGGSDAKELAALADDAAARDRQALAAVRAARGIDPAATLKLAREVASADVGSDDTVCWAAYRAAGASTAGGADVGRDVSGDAACARAMRLGTRDPSILAHTGLAALKRGDARGKELIAQALALNPAFDPIVGPEAALGVGSAPVAGKAP